LCELRGIRKEAVQNHPAVGQRRKLTLRSRPDVDVEIQSVQSGSGRQRQKNRA
jgi:hypothetical protein